MTYTAKSDDQELLEGCKQNNRLAQKHLYQRFYGKMMGIAMRYTKDKEEALEVLNRGFFKVFDKIDQFEGRGSLEAWVARIIFHSSIEHLRKKQKYRAKVKLEDQFEKDVQLDASAIQQLYVEDIHKLIQELPENSRAVFSLHIIDGYKHREIADMLEININTSKWHLAEAKKLLRTKIESLAAY